MLLNSKQIQHYFINIIPIVRFVAIGMLFFHIPALAYSQDVVATPHTALLATDAEPEANNASETILLQDLNPTIALKNNVLYDAAATPNLAIEVAVEQNWTIGLNVGYNPFPLKDSKLPKYRHIAVTTEARYYFDKAFWGPYLSLDFAYSHFNTAGSGYPIGWAYSILSTHRNQGDLVAGGAAYGWQWRLHPHWAIEVEGGMNIGYAWYKDYECQQCGEYYGEKRSAVLVPRLSLNVIWIIK